MTEEMEKETAATSVIHENPVTVTVNEAVGTMLLGLLSLVLLVALLRSQAAQRRLLRQMTAAGVAVEAK